MGALTQNYVDYAAGNDYAGTTFTNGAFTVADMTLTKAGAFAASLANHWLYLDDNGSGEVTTGYYQIASVTSANAVVLAASPKSGANDPTDVKCTQADGTALLPWRSVQGCLDLCGRDTTNGDQINVKAGTAVVNAASLVLTTYGSPGYNAPLIIRGYTSAANDGGIGEIDCGGYTAITSANNVGWADLELHSFGDNNGVNLGTDFFGGVYNCNVHKGASSPSGKKLIYSPSSQDHQVISCYVHDAGTSGAGISGGTIWAISNYVTDCVTGIDGCRAAIFNVVVDCTNGVRAYGMVNNSVYHSSASTGVGITVDYPGKFAYNNAVEGYSGAGGIGARVTGFDSAIFGNNAYYNNTTNISLETDVSIDLSAGDITCVASPFTDAAGGDFSPTDEIAELALPVGAWPGLATTSNAADIGAVQAGAGVAAAGISMPRVRIGH